MQRRPFQTIAILGLGLMGGSLGLAVRQRRVAARVVGYARRAATRRAALACGAVDATVATPEAAVRDADLVVLAVPPDAMAPLARRCRAALRPGALLTDVGSTKAEIVARLERVAQGRFACVGSHPIAGSERRGLPAARAALYDDALVVVTPTRRAERRAVRRLTAFWRLLGARVCRLTPAQHDRVLARTSHAPHLAAALLAATVGRVRARWVGRFCGSGFRDTTRVADGDPRLWVEIVRHNRVPVADELRQLRVALERLRRQVAAGDWTGVRRCLCRARLRRAALLHGNARPLRTSREEAPRGRAADQADWPQKGARSAKKRDALGVEHRTKNS